MISDVGKKIFVWKGKSSNSKEIAKATYFAKRMIEDSSTPIIFLKGKSDDPEFYYYLGGSVDLIPPKTVESRVAELENYLEYRIFVTDEKCSISELVLDKEIGLNYTILVIFFFLFFLFYFYLFFFNFFSFFLFFIFYFFIFFLFSSFCRNLSFVIF